MIIMRGLPGSGKSYIAEQKKKKYNGVICSADHYFIWNGQYLFDKKKLHNAHMQCRTNCGSALRKKQVVIVDNTNTTYEEILPYLKLAKQFDVAVKIIEPSTDWAFDVDELFKRNTHNVPWDTIKAMKDRYVPAARMQELIQNFFLE